MSPSDSPDYAPDAVLKVVRNLKVGMETTRGKVLDIEKGKGGYYNVAWDATDSMGKYPSCFAHPGDLLITVLVPR